LRLKLLEVHRGDRSLVLSVASLGLSALSGTGPFCASALSPLNGLQSLFDENGFRRWKMFGYTEKIEKRL
jgi:hypothetical protein